MVIVAVGYYRRLDPVRLDAKIPVFPVRLGPAALKGAAVNEVSLAVYLQDMLGTGHLPGGAEGIEGDIHGNRITDRKGKGNSILKR
jgi:hypothetical protein